MADRKSDLVQGTLEMLILKVLALCPMHGWGITERILQISGGVFEVNPGSLYPALQRLKRKAWVTSDWQITENSRRACFYTLTDSGRSKLEDRSASWRRSAEAVERILQAIAAN